MAAEIRYIGIDGCKDGWFCVSLADDNSWSYTVIADPRALLEYIGDAASVLIDIPIGLLDSGPGERQCDKQARALLKHPRSSSVFPAPARQSLLVNDYQQALKINRMATGRGLSRQSWGIVPKIREIDNLLSSRPVLQGVIRECHPELCFWALNDESAMIYSKKTEQGKQERLAVLAQFFKPCHQLFRQAAGQFLRRQVAHDDIIDAMVCAVTAKHGYHNYTSLPSCPQRDINGLAMEIVFYHP